MSRKPKINKTLSFLTSFVMTFTIFAYSPAETVKAYDYLSYGIDVSKYQGTIDWNAVAESNKVDFAIIRAGTTAINGENYSQDVYFESNYTNAKNAGIRLGAYYYCGAFSEDGFRQNAYDFLNSLEGKTFDFPVYIDIEQASKQQAVGKTTLTTYILSALDIIKEAGYTTGVYANKDWFTNYIDISRIRNEGYEIWWAQYPSGSHAVDPTGYDKSEDCGIWQYSSLGAVNGINGNVDVDVSYINYSDKNTTEPDPEPKPVETTYSVGNYVVNAQSGLRMRSEPNTNATILCGIPYGTQIYVEQVNGDWGYVRDVGGWNNNTWVVKSGWVSLKYCEYLDSSCETEITTTTSTATTTTTTSTTTTTTTTTTTGDNNKIPVVLPKELTINTGDTYDLVVLNCDNPENITWISSNRNVATVENGSVKAIGTGKTVIYAVINDVYCEVNVTVQDSGTSLSGDLNNDKSVTIADAVILNKYLMGSETFSQEMYYSADLNNDGFVDSFDMVLMKKMII
ncbi:MAG: hypothetical protein K2J36_04985 [Ruminococcus sp.]|nr:hypothetical protein [Ruminococcus sp.]